MYHQFNIQQFYVLPTQCIYMFCVYLRTNLFFPILYSHWLSEQIGHCACPFYGSLAGFCFDKESHPPGRWAPLQPRCVSLRLLAFPKAKIAVESEEIFECYRHTVHKLSKRRLTADWLAPRENDCSLMHSKVRSDWLPSYMKATWTVLEVRVFKMAEYFLDSPRTC